MSNNTSNTNFTQYESYSFKDKMIARVKDDPMTILGISGCIAMIAYNVHNFKNSKDTTQMFILKLRVKAQGMIVGAMGLGCLYKMYYELKDIRQNKAAKANQTKSEH